MSVRDRIGLGARRSGRTKRGSPFITGLLAIAGLVVIVYLVFNPRVPFAGHYEVRGVFSSAGQVRIGSPVRTAGVDIGRVAKVEPGPGTSRVMTLEVNDEGRPIHTDATLKIRPRVFLEGGLFIDLHPGSPSAPVLKNHGVIPLGQTTLPVKFNQILSTLDHPTRAGLQDILAQAAYGLDGGGAEGLRRTIAPLAPTLRNVAWISQAARGTSPGDLSTLIASTAGITSTLAGHDAQLADLVTNLNSVSGTLAQHDRALARTIVTLDRVIRHSPAALTELDRAFPVVDRFAAAVRPALPIAPSVLNGAANLLTQANGLASKPELPALLTLADPAVRELPSLTGRLTDLFPLVTPVVQCVRELALPVLNAQLDDPPNSTNQPVYQDLVHGGVGLASATQSFDGNGMWLRLLGAIGPNTFSTGAVPGLGSLIGSSEQPVQGARPVWNGVSGLPPFRPDVPCGDNGPVNLAAAAGPGVAKTKTATAKAPTPAAAKKLLRELLHPQIPGAEPSAGRTAQQKAIEHATFQRWGR